VLTAAITPIGLLLMLERTFTTNMCIGMQMGTCHLPIFVKNVILFAKPWFLISANSCPHDLGFRL
jgi:hypothetical protein